MELLLLQLFIRLIFGIIAAAIASSKGRSVVGWFFIGFFTAIIGVIIVLVLSNLKDEKSYRNHSDRENRRLREQLHQERVKNESFRQHTMERIDSHDQHLGIDTRKTQTALPAQGMGSFIDDDGDWEDAETNTLLPSDDSQEPRGYQASKREWHYIDEGETVGPISQSHLLSMLRSGELEGSTLLWTEKLADWKEASQIRGLRRFINP